MSHELTQLRQPPESSSLLPGGLTPWAGTQHVGAAHGVGTSRTVRPGLLLPRGGPWCTVGMSSALVPSLLCSAMPHVPQFALTPARYWIFLRRSEMNLRRARATWRITSCLRFQPCLNFCVRLFTPQYPARGRAGCTACLWEDLVAPLVAPAACSHDWPGAMPASGRKHHMHPPWRTSGAVTLYFLSPLRPRVPAWPPSRLVDFVPLPAGAPARSRGDAARASWPVPLPCASSQAQGDGRCHGATLWTCILPAPNARVKIRNQARPLSECHCGVFGLDCLGAALPSLPFLPAPG